MGDGEDEHRIVNLRVDNGIREAARQSTTEAGRQPGSRRRGSSNQFAGTSDFSQKLAPETGQGRGIELLCRGQFLLGFEEELELNYFSR